MQELDALDSKHILVVEDDFVLAREICSHLQGHGATIIGPAPTVHYARLIMGHRKVDGAVLDIRLFGEDVYSLADELTATGVPIVFATAYRAEQVAERFRDAAILHKPIDLGKLLRSVSRSRPLATMPAPMPSPVRVPAGPASGETLFDKWSRALARSMRERG